jgi:putative endonuclease
LETRSSTGRPDSGARKRFGATGEHLAAVWMQQQGYKIVARNWRCPCGELDSVGERGGELVFVEVKARRGARMGTAAEAVTPTKQRRLVRSAQYFLMAHGQEQRPYRIDVITVEVAPSGNLLNLRHYPGCVESEG